MGPWCEIGSYDTIVTAMECVSALEQSPEIASILLTRDDGRELVLR